MQKITFLTVGRVKTPWIAEACTEFLRRLAPTIDLQRIELTASRNVDPKKYAAEESATILEKLQKFPDADIWLLDEKGKAMTSPAFSSVIEKAADAGRPLVFVLGGSYGTTDELKQSLSHQLRLSDMTFPHDVCQAIFLEQLYRALEIRKGSGYHH